MDWQPIETAPKDGSEFLAYCEAGDAWLLTYDPDADGFFAFDGAVEGGGRVYVSCATHWMPLPPPPTPNNHEGE